MASRNLADLTEDTRAKAEALLAKAALEGITLLVTCTYRSDEEQAAEYARGRTTPGPIVTYAKPGDSWHQWRAAFDVVPLRNGKPVWGTSGPDGELWRRVGAIGKGVGLEWAGDWSKFREFPHFQNTQGRTIAQMRAGYTLR